MDQLWAPWRMAYIQESEPAPGCLFCTKIREDADEANFILLRAQHCFVMLNLYPYNSGHVMVVPYQHTGEFQSVRPEVLADVMTIAQLSVSALGEVMKPEGFNLGINQGKVAGAGVPDHVHLHILPRWNGDTNFMPALADVKVIPESLPATADKLRPILHRLAAAGT
jgi:ATP adenylyltransferase